MRLGQCHMYWDVSPKVRCCFILVCSFFLTVRIQGVDIRIKLESGEWYGALEIQLDVEDWSFVCDDGFGLNEAQIVCKSLLKTRSDAQIVAVQVKLTRYDSTRSKRILITDLTCTGEESHLGKCTAHTDSRPCDKIVYMFCGYDDDSHVRLAGGDTTRGRVELGYRGSGSTIHYGGSVCSSGFDGNAAKVVCRQLGFPTEDAKVVAGYRDETIAPWINIVDCTGDEKNLFWCKRNNLEYCPGEHSVAVSCRDTDTGSSVGLIVGIVVGVVAALVIIVACVIFVRTRLRKPGPKPAANPAVNPTANHVPNPVTNPAVNLAANPAVIPTVSPAFHGSNTSMTQSVQWNPNQGSQIIVANGYTPIPAVTHFPPPVVPQVNTTYLSPVVPQVNMNYPPPVVPQVNMNYPPPVVPQINMNYPPRVAPSAPPIATPQGNTNSQIPRLAGQVAGQMLSSLAESALSSAFEGAFE